MGFCDASRVIGSDSEGKERTNSLRQATIYHQRPMSVTLVLIQVGWADKRELAKFEPERVGILGKVRPPGIHRFRLPTIVTI